MTNERSPLGICSAVPLRGLARVLVAVALICAAAVLAAPTAARAAAFSWSSPKLVNTQEPDSMPNSTAAVSCANAQDCAAAVWNNLGPNYSGSVVTTTDAPAGAGSWTAPHVLDSHTIDAIACPSTSLCVAADSWGDVLHSTDPFSNSPTWSAPVSLLPAGVYGTLDELACPTVNLCVALDNHRDVYSTTAPTGVAAGWHGVTLNDWSNSLSCPTADFCAIGADSGDVFTTTTPTGPAADWSSADVDAGIGGLEVLTLSCASSTLCVAFDEAGRALSSTNPAASAPTWTAPRTVDTAPENPVVTAVSCPSAGLCVALDGNGTEFSSTDPGSATATWSSAALFTSGGFDSLTCPTTSFCVAAAVQGDASTTTDPAGGGSTWSTAAQISGGYDTVPSVSCATLTLCVAVSSADVDTSIAPAQNTWTIGDIDPSAALLEVSCPSASLCVAVDTDGYVFWSQNPAGGAGTWIRSTHPIDSAQITGLSCPSTQLCVAVDALGNVLTSNRPVGGGWGPRKLPTPTDRGELHHVLRRRR